MNEGAVIRGKYQIEREIGRQSYSVLYRARHVLWNEPRAIRVLEAHGDDESARKILSAGRMMRQVKHPQVARVEDIDFTEDGRVFIVTEWVAGTDLGALVNRESRIPPLMAVSITHQICAGLDAIHKHGMLHGNLKASNVLLVGRPPGQAAVKLTDFGATVGHAESAALDPSGDIHAAGMLLEQMLSGAPPTQDGNGQENSIPTELSEIACRALASDPRERYTSAADMARALAQASRRLAPAKPLKRAVPRLGVPVGGLALVMYGVFLVWSDFIHPAIVASRGSDLEYSTDPAAYVRPPRIRQLTASASRVPAGGWVTLNWSADYASYVFFDHGGGRVPISGSLTVHVWGSSTLTLTAWGGGKYKDSRTTASVHVDVR